MSITTYIERFFNVRALERELSIEKTKVSELNLKINALSSENNELRQKINEFEELHKNPIEFDPSTGTWIGTRNGNYYCAKCKAHNKESPMKNIVDGWECPACGSAFKITSDS
jgi:DNA-directed RNA polymerase subunit RPC12/RpoP